MIPLPLYVSLEIIKLLQVYFINQDLDLYYEPTDKRVECRALNITEDLGQVEFVFSDKTGTLTENQMEFKSCTIAGKNYPHTAGNSPYNIARSCLLLNSFIAPDKALFSAEKYKAQLFRTNDVVNVSLKH